jgi:hypothetical protein
MKFGVLVAAFSVVASGAANASGEVRIEQASAGRPYDLVVHVRTSRPMDTTLKSPTTASVWRCG